MVRRAYRELRLVYKLGPRRQTLKWLVGIIRHMPQIVRTRSLHIADQCLGSPVAVRTPRGLLEFVDTDFGVVREIFGHHSYGRPETIAEAKEVLDLGGNTGVFAHFALTSSSKARTHLVEAQPDLCSTAIANLARNRLSSRCTVVNAIVGNPQGSWIEKIRSEAPAIKTFDIGHYLSTVGMCDFLKCDIEGSEFDLFSGSLQWLQFVRRMAIEYHWNKAAGEKLKRRLEAYDWHIEMVSHRQLGYLICQRK